MLSLKSLEAIADSELLSRIESLTRRDAVLTVRSLEYIGEIDRRELYLSLGHGSLFDFLTRRLRFSEPAAFKRTRAARALRAFPELRELLLSREISLSTLCLVSSFLDSEVISAIRGKSKREVEAYVASRKERTVVPREVIRPIVVRKVVPVETAPLFSVSPGKIPEPEAAPEPEVPAQKRFSITLSVDEAGMQLIRQVQEILSRGSGRVPTVEEVLQATGEEFVKRKAPEKRAERRAARVAKPAPTPKKVVVTRHIPAAVRDEVFVRDDASCMHVSPDGTACMSRIGIQIDHVMPWALGGHSTPENLRCLCAKHNRHRVKDSFARRAPE